MKTFNFLIIATTVFMMSCMSSPQGEKAKTSDIYDIQHISVDNALNVDLEQSKIEWLGIKPLGTHFGDLMLSSATIDLKDNEIVGGKILIDMNTIRTIDLANTDMEAQLVGHLKSCDFFCVDSFPTATFEIAGINALKSVSEKKPDDEIIPTHEVKGNLTIRGNTRGIAFNALIEINEEKVVVKTNLFYINRTYWNVNYGSKSIFAELKDNFINDEMGIKIDFLAIKK